MYSCKCLGLTDPPPSCRPKQLNAWKGSLALKGPLGGGQCARPPGNHSCRPRAGRLRSPRLPTSRPPPPCAQEVGLFTFTSRWARLPPVVTTPWLPGPAGFSPPESKGPYPWGPASQPPPGFWSQKPVAHSEKPGSPGGRVRHTSSNCMVATNSSNGACGADHNECDGVR